MIPIHNCAGPQPVSTLVAGPNCYEEINGVQRISEKTLRMLRIFTDHLFEPVIAGNRVEASDFEPRTVTLPSGMQMHPLNAKISPPLHQRIFPDINWNRKHLSECLRGVGAVYCRYPSWEAVHIHRIAIARELVAFASIHGNWAEVYEKMAAFTPQPKRLLLSRLARRVDLAIREVAKTSRVLFCVGQDLADRYGRFAPHTVVFANYMHEEVDINEREDTCQNPPFKILYVGELHQRKGIEVFLDAGALLHKQGYPVELHIVGDGTLLSALKARSKALDIEPITFFRGFIPFGAELLAIYRECDLFMLPSLSGEGCPKTLVEAMSQGTPVIGTDVGSVRYMLSDGLRGLVVPSGSAGDLAESAVRILTNTAIRMHLIRGGLDFAHTQTYSVQRRRIGEALREYIPQVVRTSPEGAV